MNRSIQTATVGLMLAFLVSPALAKRPPPIMPSPTIDAGVTHTTATLTIAEASPHHMMRPLNEANTIVYEQMFGGGGAAAGILLGPLGVAANMKGIESRTTKEAAEIYGKIAIDVQALLNAALADSGLALAGADNSAAATIKPVLDVVSLDGERVGFAIYIVVDQRPAGKNWTGRYLYQLDASYPRAIIAQGLAPEEVQALESEASQGLREVVRYYIDDGAGKLAGDGKVRFYSDFLTTRIKYKMQAQPVPGLEGRFVVRLPTTIASLPQNQVRLDK